jgi:heme exporter protein C
MSQRRSPAIALILVTGAVVAAALYAAVLHAPTERTMGTIQRIFYFHVPAGMVGIGAFLLVFIGSLAFLITRNLKWDRFAEASAEIGLLYTTIVLITGPIWAKPVWGIWWTWDARLTSTLVLWFIYWAYVLIRAYVTRPARRALLSAVVGVLGAVDAPIVYFSIRWWRTQHPSPVIGGGSGSGLEPRMREAFLIALVAYVLLFAVFAMIRMRLARVESEVEEVARLASEPGPAARGTRAAHATGARSGALSGAHPRERS